MSVMLSQKSSYKWIWLCFRQGVGALSHGYVSI